MFIPFITLGMNLTLYYLINVILDKLYLKAGVTETGKEFDNGSRDYEAPYIGNQVGYLYK